ncbi:LacI family transcriptional regulator [Mycobacteroides abscessus subsp. abscessus]|nr:LacI family transcriptional regulator [Mycobacteroides abscessus subsp. abscessus]
MGKKVTLADVATAAQVSTSTVSKVLNNRPGVGLDVRARVRRTAVALGYLAPNQYPEARRLMVIFDALSSPYSSEVLTGILGAATAGSFDVLLNTVESASEHSADGSVSEWLKSGGHKSDGFIFVTTALTPELAESIRFLGLPVAFVDPTNTVGSDIVRIGATNWAGGREATEHLLDLGHRRIAHIAGPILSDAAIDRHEGYRSALTRHGVEYRKAYVRTSPFTFEGGLEAGLDLLGLEERPSAIFAASDATALGVLEAARSLGIHVPYELSVVGFDNTTYAEQSAPPLTVVHQPLYEMGVAAVNAIVGLLSNPDSVTRRLQLETGFVKRGSTAPPPAIG